VAVHPCQTGPRNRRGPTRPDQAQKSAAAFRPTRCSRVRRSRSSHDHTPCTSPIWPGHVANSVTWRHTGSRTYAPTRGGPPATYYKPAVRESAEPDDVATAPAIPVHDRMVAARTASHHRARGAVDRCDLSRRQRPVVAPAVQRRRPQRRLRGLDQCLSGPETTPSSGTASPILGRRWRNLLHSHSPSCCPLGWPSASARSLAPSIRTQGEQVGNSQGDDGCCVLAMHHAARERVLPVITAVNDPLCIC